MHVIHGRTIKSYHESKALACSTGTGWDIASEAAVMQQA